VWRPTRTRDAKSSNQQGDAGVSGRGQRQGNVVQPTVVPPSGVGAAGDPAGAGSVLAGLKEVAY
jgi:hypothetical protein